MDALAGEINPNIPPAAASTGYRKSLALSLFYKVQSYSSLENIYMYMYIHV